MKQGQIMMAYNTIVEHENDNFPLKVSYAFYKVKELLKSQYEFQQKEEKAVFEKYKPIQEDGKLKFKDDQEANEFLKEYSSRTKELSEMDIDLGDYKVWVLPMQDDLKLSVSDLECLEPFIKFE